MAHEETSVDVLNSIYDDDAQAIGGIRTLLIDGLAVEGRAAKQHYHIRILLYGAALAQVKPLELNRYIGSGQPWGLDLLDGGVFVLPPYMKAKSGEWYLSLIHI